MNNDNDIPEDDFDISLDNESAQEALNADLEAAMREEREDIESGEHEELEHIHAQSEPNERAIIEALQDELDKAKDTSLRAMAEAENARKRAIREKTDAANFAITGFARDLLGVADNLRRALDAVPGDLAENDVRIQNLLEGIEATERELLRGFEKNGLKAINPEGENFDPNFHEVMFESPAAPGQKAGAITQIIETGYILNDRLLRPARVGVAKDNGANNNTAAEGQNTPPRAGGSIDTKV